MNIRRFALLSLTPFLLWSCVTNDRPDPVEIKQSLDNSLADSAQQQIAQSEALPPEVEAELMPLLQQPEMDALLQHQEKRLTINANGVPADLFFASLIKDTPYSSAVHPGVQGNITLSLQQATLTEVLDLVSELYGYDIQKKGRIYHIYPAGMRVETIPLNYLMMTRDGTSRTSIASGRLSDNNNNSTSNNSNYASDNSSDDSYDGRSSNNETGFNGTKIETRTKTDYWKELETMLSSLIGTGNGRTILVSPQAGLVTVRAFPDEIRTIKAYLQQAETHLQRQVVLEAKILEVNLSDEYQQGIDWNTASSLNTTDILFGSVSRLADSLINNTIGGGGALTIKNGNFEAVINLLDTQGDVNVLSSPRITASNNQKAVIKVGTDEYFVTDVSSTTISGTTPITNPSVELTPFFSGIALDVTPQINDIGEVILHVHPSVTDVTEQRKQIGFSSTDTDLGTSAGEGLDIPLAKSDIRESDTVVKATTGDVVVIGGLMRSYQKELVSKTPFIGDIPWLGELFTNRQQVTTKTELVILIKPTLVSQETWSQELERSRELLETWYPNNDEQQNNTAEEEKTQ